MKFWAIAYKFQEDVFYDFKKHADSIGLEPSCLLPTKKLASQFIEDELNTDDYGSIGVNIETLSKQGVMSWSREPFKEWDEEY
ncbi:hypothetical protein [Virgibacillus halodenitrificans]|uniref:hypothetical protein n=1 Tax=Virgibacillus halodenitrificans TaxID=1482 RepID=UPI000EF52B73|nr:hypothetical protein [Virgibacillus halodenitrificans]